MKPQPKLVKVSIKEVKRQIKTNGEWVGMIVGNNVSPYHVVGGWGLGCKIEVDSEKELEKQICYYKYFNADREIWRNYSHNPHFYQIKQETTK